MGNAVSRAPVQARVTPGFDVRLSASRPEPGIDKRREARDRQGAFKRDERQEMTLERRALHGKALRWAMVVAIPSALFGLASCYVFTLMRGGDEFKLSVMLVAVNLILGAFLGALGAAIAALLFHSLFEEDGDIPLITISVMTLFTIAGGVYGASQGSSLAIAAGVALGAAVGLCGGIAVWIAFSALKGLYLWVHKETRGY